MRQLLIPLIIFVLAMGLVVNQSGAVSATMHTPNITLSSNRGEVGDLVTVTGTGFFVPAEDGTPSAESVSSVTVTFDGRVLRGTSSISITDGRWSTRFNVPKISRGPKSIIASPDVGQAGLDTFIVESSAKISPTSGKVNDTIRVTGEGFTSGAAVEISFDGERVGRDRANGDGSISDTFEVPALPAGTYDVEIGNLSALDFRITSSFSVTPATGPTGTTITISGSGFEANTTGELKIGNTVIQEVSTDSDGVLDETVNIPQVPGGSQKITTTKFGTASANFTVTPTLTANRANATPGAEVTLSGTGFGSRETNIVIKFDSAIVASGITADEQGRWTGSFQVPKTTAGSHRLRASGRVTSESSVPAVSLSVAAGFDIITPSGPPGTIVPLHGSGSRAGERITITIGQGLASVVAVADAQGVWDAEVTIPPAPRGALNIVAKGATSQPLTNTFSVTPTFAVEESSGIAGSSVNVNGQGFSTNQTGITVTFDGNVVATVNANAQGSWTGAFNVPAAAKGTYLMAVSDAAVGAQIPFTIAPAITLPVDQSVPLGNASIRGSGFGANEGDITVSLSGISLASQITADANGFWSANFTVPELAWGQYSITASGPQTTATGVEAQILTITPILDLSVVSGPTGTSIGVTGRGFEGNGQGLGVAYDGAPVASGVNTDAWGRFTAAFDAPISPAGNHPVTVSNSAASAPAADFQIVPSIEIDIAQGSPGTSVTVNGTGFGSNESNIILSYGNQELSSTVSADAQGTFAAAVTIPSSIAGIQRLRASGPLSGQTGRPELPFQVIPELTLSDPSGSVGSKLDVIGQGFEPNKSLTISYDDTKAASVTTDGSGSFLARVTVPSSRHGRHLIQASDASGSRIGATFSVEETPPPVPVLLSPKDGDKGGLWGGFAPTQKWSEVEDPSGVSYSLVIARDQDFSDVVLEREGLAKPIYVLTEEEALSRGKYYWRVKAVDQAANESEWSAGYVVQSGIVPIWVIPLLVVLGLVASGSGAYAFLRFRRAQPPPRIMMPEAVQITRPELGTVPALPGEVTPTAPTVTTPTVTAPPRRALPSPFRRNREPSPEEQARLQLAVDFIRAIPLLEVAPDLAWTEALAEEMGDTPAVVRQQVLLADRALIYRPAWQEHPTYVELQENAQARNFFQSLEVYVTAANDCAADASALLQQIYRSIADSGADEELRESQWRYVITVAQSSIAWFRGTYLGQPSAREYEVAPALGSVDDDLVSLHWLAIPSLAGPLVEGISQEEAAFYQDLHIQLRNVYRANEQARLLAAKLASTDAIRAQLFQAISQLGQG